MRKCNKTKIDFLPQKKLKPPNKNYTDHIYSEKSLSVATLRTLDLHPQYSEISLYQISKHLRICTFYRGVHSSAENFKLVRASSIQSWSKIKYEQKTNVIGLIWTDRSTLKSRSFEVLCGRREVPQNQEGGLPYFSHMFATISRFMCDYFHSFYDYIIYFSPEESTLSSKRRQF